VPCFVHYDYVSGFCSKEALVATAYIRSATPTNFIAKPLAVRVYFKIFDR